MTITVPVNELLDRSLWQEFCEATGTNEYAVNEGQIDSNTSLEIPESMHHYFLERTPV